MYPTMHPAFLEWHWTVVYRLWSCKDLNRCKQSRSLVTERLLCVFESHQAFSHIQILLPRVSLVTSLAIARAYLKSFRSVFKASNLCNLTVSQTWHPYSIICESQLTFILLLLPDQQSPVEQVVPPSLLILEKTPFPPPPLSLFFFHLISPSPVPFLPATLFHCIFTMPLWLSSSVFLF